MTRRCIGFSLLLLGGAACSSSTATGETGPAASTATVDATFPFLPAHVSSASAVAAKGLDDPAYPNQVTVIIATAVNFCAVAQSLSPNSGVANLFDLVMVLGSTSAANMVLPGTYNLGGAMHASYTMDNASCQVTSSGSATAGTVTVTSVTPSVAGNLDLTFAGGRVAGSFNASFCSLPTQHGDAGTSVDGGVISCVPGGIAPL